MGNSTTYPPTSVYNEEIPNSKRQGFTPIYRKKGQKVFVETLEPSITNMRHVLYMIKEKYGAKEGLGQVIIEKEVNEKGEEIEKRTIKSHTYNQVYDTAYSLGRSIFKRKLYYQQSLYRMKLIGIYSKNRYQWFISDWACVLFGLTSVPLYDTLGVENLTYCLNQTEMTTLLVSVASLKTLLTLQDIGKVKTIISYDRVDQDTLKKAMARGLSVLNYLDLIKEGQTSKQINCETVPIKREDIYTFSYTSGTTGPPKGAIFSHRNFLAGICCFFEHADGDYNHNDRYVSYLPLPHLLERIFSTVLFYAGAYVVVSSGNPLKLKQDCQAVKPTIFLGVPRIYNRIVEAVKNRFEGQTGIKKCLIDNAVDTKMKTMKQTGEFTHCLYDSLVFSKVREGFGGCIRQLATGSAPINSEVEAFMKIVMSSPMLEGYGQTQNTGCAILSRSMQAGLCEISSGLEVKLCDIPQMKYTSKDVDEDGKLAPRGQIWLRGPLVFKGYYKLPEVTKETVNEQGWLKTGDVAQFQPESMSFKIIDRRKNIFKLQQGEYLAPDRIENKYLKSKLISEIFLHGDSQQNFAVAIIAPNRDELQILAKEKGIEGNHSELCANLQIRKLILTEINELGRRQHLNGFELAKNIYLEEENFLAKKILTNTLKLIRHEARLVYKQQIKQLYQEGQLLNMP